MRISRHDSQADSPLARSSISGPPLFPYKPGTSAGSSLAPILAAEIEVGMAWHTTYVNIVQSNRDNAEGTAYLD
jgi:hypothetical protein